MPSVAIIYDEHLTGLSQTRCAMKRAMEAVGFVPRWQEWRRDVAACPPHRPYSKVIVLVDGKDVSTGFANLAECCVPEWQPTLQAHVERLQATVDGVTPAQLLVARDPRPRTGWLGNAAAIFVALMPKFTCPLCLPLYSSVLSVMGLGFLKQQKYLLLLTAIVLLLALANLALQGRRRKDFLPLRLGAAGAALLLVGKFALDAPPLGYAGAILLMAGCFWHSWSLPRLLERARGMLRRPQFAATS